MSNVVEMLEYYDEYNKEKIGVAERKIIHENELWHREVAVWVMNNKKELLLQRRSPKKEVGANKLSITAGHIDVGESPVEAALREVREEIGLKLISSDLNFIGIYRNVQKNNHCFSYTYLVRTNKGVEQMTMQEEEVSELMYISIDDLEKRMKEQDEEISFSKKDYVKEIVSKIKCEVR